MRGFNQNVPAVCKRKKVTVTQPGHEILYHVIVSARDEAKRDLRRIQALLQLKQIGSDLRTGVMVQPRKDMGGAGYTLDALSHICARHINRCRQIGSTVIQTWQDVTMQIDHKPNSPRIERLLVSESPDA